MTAPATPPSTDKLPYTKDDFVSGSDVRWCPGCGDYAILSVMQKTLADFTPTKRENHVFISGIGCSSRFPYYMKTYGFHTIHGRAPTIASGLKLVRPDLTTWVITGDGDGLSIGGNHLIHCLRRNMDLKIVLVNNEIYGLTKGQYSPTSKLNQVTKSTPEGAIDYPVNPLCIAIAAEATFIARTFDSDPRHMSSVFKQAMDHKGVAFIEVFQNCVIFNKDTHVPIVGREHRDDRALYLEDGKPLIFGKNKDKGVKLNGILPEVVDLAAKPEEAKNVLVHNAKEPMPNYSYLLTQLEYPDYPVPFGVFRDIKKPTYGEMLDAQVKAVTDKRGPGKLKDILYTSDVWKVEAKGGQEAKPAEKKFIESTTPEKNYWHQEEYAKLVKEGGTIGEEAVKGAKKDKLAKMIMSEKVSDFISKTPPIIVSPETSIQEMIDKMHQFPSKGCALVCGPDGKLVGIASIRDVLLKVAGLIKEPAKVPVKSIMTPKPECLDKDAELSYALHKMAIGKFRHVPVVDNGVPLGVVSTRDLIEYLTAPKKK
jgi:2-oxoglutarate/2-oxoacid ferredoxin oxidoreductase subunit beta